MGHTKNIFFFIEEMCLGGAYVHGLALSRLRDSVEGQVQDQPQARTMKVPLCIQTFKIL